MILGEANNIRHSRRFAHSHSGGPQIFLLGEDRDATTGDTIAPLNFRGADNNSSRHRIVFHFGNLWQTARSRSAIVFQIQSISTSSVPVAFLWGQSCVQYQGRSARPPSKANDQSSVTMNNCSVRYFPKSPEHFGHKKQRRILLLPPIVRCVLRSFISLAIEIGRAMLSRPSSPKSCAVTPCATSRSFPNGSRRPF